MTKKIALFGTSADPPTAGHQSILHWLSLYYDKVAVWASDNPFKEHQTPLHQREEMLRLMVEDIDGNCHNIKVYEQLSDRRSLFSVLKAREMFGDDAEYSLVIGSDLVNQIRRWYQVEELLQKVTILIIPRLGYSLNEKDLQALKAKGGNWAIADLDVPGVSSTDYREEGDEKALTASVAQYIQQQQLY